MTLDVSRLIIASAALAAALTQASGDGLGGRTSARVEWAAGRIVIESSVAIAGFADPRARFEAETETRAELPGLFLAYAPSLVITSWDTLGGAADADPALAGALAGIAGRGTLDASRMSEDLSTVRLAWTFPLFGPDGVASLLVTHKLPFPLTRPLGDVPAGRYTGVVIYAAEPLPSWGTSAERLPRPALFPRIFDEGMSLVLDKEMCDPASLVRWGMVAYTDDPADPGPEDRIGQNPLRILARGVFGRNDTDLLIPAESARRLLATEENSRLLREGRILVIYRSVSTPLSQAAPPAPRP
jgi:hypothetical protein